MRIPVFLLSLSFLFNLSSYAQERCGIVAYEKMKGASSLQKKEERFEQWMRGKIALRATKSAQRTQAIPYVIPVVVHVIHNGESIGTGTNISDAQIQSQIDVLNADFRRLNADATNTPTEFQSVAGSMDIQFVLAKQDPFGVTTNGIVRVKGTKSSWTMNDEATFKGLSFWRSDWYLNLWVLNLTDFLGYGQFPDPQGTSLSGLTEPDMTHDSTLDGAAIAYRAFGSGNFDLEANYNKGRTVTHEIGHFFGLRHIWGDNSNCNSTTDYVDDTPKQNASTSGCPSNPQTSCSVHKMFQNYLDYTSDACMNLFTQGQMNRMDIVINNAARRKSLLSSPGATPTTSQPQLDIALSELKSPGPVVCISKPVPLLAITNSGNTLIQTFTLETIVNGGTAITQSFNNVDLVPGEEREFSLNAISLNTGVNTILFTVKNPNGLSDNTSNNSLKYNIVVSTSADILPLRQNFNNDFTSWSFVSPNDGLIWNTITTNYSRSLQYKSFTNTSSGQQSWVVSPTLDLSNLTEASVHFDLSYALRSNLALERLQVFASEDCGLTYPKIIYDKQGDEFNSTTSLTSWLPSKADDWQNQYVPLDDFVGKTNIRLAWVVTNRNGNNLYLDNFDFYEDDSFYQPTVAENYYIYAASARLEEYRITFNLEERADVSLYVYNLLGQKIAEHQLSNVLNQTYPIDLISNQTGIYIVRTKIGSQFFSNKIFLAR